MLEEKITSWHGTEIIKGRLVPCKTPELRLPTRRKNVEGGLQFA